MADLRDDFYTVKEKKQISEKEISVVIELNQTHAIYSGHFPDQPIVPGVCQIQIVKEILEDLMGKKLKMITGDNIKFMGMIIPNLSPIVNIDVNYQINDSEIICDSKLFFGETIFTKYKGKFKTA